MLMEPWDGPAALVFTDGRSSAPRSTATACAPAASWSPTTASSCSPARSACSTSTRPRIVRKGRLRPGKMFLVDTDAGRIIEDDEIKAELAAAEPWGEWLEAGRIHLDDLPEREHIVHTPASVTRRQRTFGYTEEEVRILLAPDGAARRRAARRHGLRHPDRRAVEAPAAALRLLHAAVRAGHQPAAGLHPRRGRHLDDARPRPGAQPARRRHPSTPARSSLDFPVIDNDELAKIQHIDTATRQPGTTTIRGPLPRRRRARARCEPASTRCATRSTRRSTSGAQFLVLSRPRLERDLAPIPSLLMLAAVHHHLIRSENRMKVGLIVEAGDVREVHHVALLIGYGASADQPVPGHGDRRGARAVAA